MTVRRRVQPYDTADPYCGARKRQPTYPGETCWRPAGWGTWHPGCGKCKLHGGARRYKHGLYSRVVRTHILPSVARQLARYSISTLVTILSVRIPDDERRLEVLELVLNETGLIDFLEVDDAES
jgi:hypothetical protein